MQGEDRKPFQETTKRVVLQVATAGQAKAAARYVVPSEPEQDKSTLILLSQPSTVSTLLAGRSRGSPSPT